MAKVVLDWKAPSERKMADFVGTLSDEKKKSFAEACVGRKEDGKVEINKAKAKKWLTKEFDGTDEIQWEKRPEKKQKKMSGADTIASWLEI